MELSDRLAAFYRDYPYRQISVAGTAWRYRTGGARAAIADFTGHHRPAPGDLPGWHRPILVLQSEYDRAFAAQAEQIRAVYPDARFRVLAGAGHGALSTHTAAYLREVRAFLAAQPTPGGQRPAEVFNQ
jgi:pimeloyl-ACP methyl ester carboxylesterase